MEWAGWLCDLSRSDYNFGHCGVVNQDESTAAKVCTVQQSGWINPVSYQRAAWSNNAWAWAWCPPRLTRGIMYQKKSALLWSFPRLWRHAWLCVCLRQWCYYLAKLVLKYEMFNPMRTVILLVNVLCSLAGVHHVLWERYRGGQAGGGRMRASIQMGFMELFHTVCVPI